MRVYFGQIYVKAGVEFPFTHLMQRYLSDRVSALVSASDSFVERFGADWSLTVRLSADDEITDNKVLGPTRFPKTRDVEFSLFLPYSIIVAQDDVLRNALQRIVLGTIEILGRAAVDPARVVQAREAIVSEILSRPEMFEADRSPSRP